MHPDQLAHCVRDAEIMEWVNKGHLKLVLIDNFPEIFSYCRRAPPGKDINSSRADEDEVGPALRLLCRFASDRWIKASACFSSGGARPSRG